MELSAFPALNASLNALSAIFLTAGFILIKRRAIMAHKIAMLCACASSAVFLGCYLYYHFHHGATRFQGQGPVRMLYFAILISHTLLAVAIVPMIFTTLFRGISGNFPKHIAIGRKTLPLWVYVSVTGVVIYWMLYRL